MRATKPYIEKTREFFGLLIINGALLINYFVSKDSCLKLLQEKTANRGQV